MNISTHSTETLARKAARRHGRDCVYIVECFAPKTGGNEFVVIATDALLPFHEEYIVYEGLGYTCPVRKEAQP